MSFEVTIGNKKHDGVDIKKGIEYCDVDLVKCNISSRPKMDPSHKTICIIAICATLIISMALCIGRVSYYRTDLNIVNTIEQKKNDAENKSENVNKATTDRNLKNGK